MDPRGDRSYSGSRPFFLWVMSCSNRSKPRRRMHAQSRPLPGKEESRCKDDKVKMESGQPPSRGDEGDACDTSGGSSSGPGTNNSLLPAS